MPPFEAEPAERSHNSIPFLKQCVHDPTPGSGSGGSPPKPFGTESAEPTTGVKPKRASVKRVVRPFQAETEEGDHKPVGPQKKAKPFKDELGEGDELSSGSSSGCEDDYKPKTIRFLHWDGKLLTDFKQLHFGKRILMRQSLFQDGPTTTANERKLQCM